MKKINITEIKGIQIGQVENQKAGTGCTVIICKDGATAGVDVRGGGPANRPAKSNQHGPTDQCCNAKWRQCLWTRCG